MNAFPTNARILRAAAMAITLVTFVTSARAATLFTENFSDNSPSPNMALGTDSGSPVTDFTGDFTTGADGTRVYLGTNDTDYNSINFIFEATVTMAANDSPYGYAFFGMGNHDATGGFGEPGNPNLLGALDPAGALRSRDDGAGGPTATIDTDTYPVLSGTHRLRMTWNATSEQGLFQVDLNYTGIFASDYSVTLNDTNSDFDSTNSRLLLGGGNGISFDNISVTAVPEPAGLLLACCGIAGLIRFRRRKLIGK